MRNLLKIAIAATALVSSSAFAGLSANAGFVSDYYFRGVNLGDGGAYVGLDYEAESGFYVGTWAIDDATGGNDGMEIDFYGGYGFSAGPVEIGIGVALYEYTYDFEAQTEVSLTLGAGLFGLELTSGTDDNAVSETVSDSDYTYVAASLSGEVFGVTLGSFENDDAAFEYTHLEVSAGGEVAGLDMSVTIGHADFDGSTTDGFLEQGYIFLDISKGFDL